MIHHLYVSFIGPNLWSMKIFSIYSKESPFKRPYHPRDHVFFGKCTLILDFVNGPFFCQGMTWECYKNTSYAPILRCSLAAPTLRYPKDLTSHQSGMRWHVVHFLCRYRYRSVYQFSKLFSEIVLVSLICSSVGFFAKERRLQCCANRTSTHISNMFFRKMPCGWF